MILWLVWSPVWSNPDAQACLLFNHMNPLPGVLGKVEAAVDRVYQPPVPNRSSVGANLTANDVRENQERDAKASDTRRDIMRTLTVAKALLALEQSDFRKTGEELTELLEDGGLGDKEGEVRDAHHHTLPDYELIGMIGDIH